MFYATYQHRERPHEPECTIYIQDVDSYLKDDGGYLVRYQPHLQLESHLLPMREGTITIVQGEKSFAQRMKARILQDVHDALDKIYLGHLVTPVSPTEEVFAYRFNGGEYFTEKMQMFIGNYLRLKLPNADVIVTQKTPRNVVTYNLPLNPQKDRIVKALDTMSGIKSAAAYREFWSGSTHQAVNSYFDIHYDTCEVLSAQYGNEACVQTWSWADWIRYVLWLCLMFSMESLFSASNCYVSAFSVTYFVLSVVNRRK